MGKNAGESSFMEEPTLEILTRKYEIIAFKHCFPVGRILEDKGTPNIDSNEKRVENYKLQYNALKTKMHSFPDNSHPGREFSARVAPLFAKFIIDVIESAIE